MPHGKERHALAPPAGQVRHVDLGVADQVQLGRVDDPPAARPAATALERPDQIVSERGRREAVRSARTRVDVELAVQDLPGHPLWEAFELFIQGRAGAGGHVQSSVARAGRASATHARPGTGAHLPPKELGADGSAGLDHGSAHACPRPPMVRIADPTNGGPAGPAVRTVPPVAETTIEAGRRIFEKPLP
jgi:hypothetical protein